MKRTTVISAALASPRARLTGIPKEVLAFCAISVMLSIATANPLLTVAGGVTLALIFKLLSRSTEPPVLLFAAGYQWLQVFVPVLSADLAGVALQDDTLVPSLDTAAYLGFAALLFLAVGMRIGRGTRDLDSYRSAILELPYLRPRNLAWVYVLSHAVNAGAHLLGNAVAGLRQPLLALELFRWAVVFIIMWGGVHQHRLRRLAGAVLVLELVLGMMGFFADFRQVIFIATVVALAASGGQALLSRRVVVLVLMAAPLVIFWQAVKVDYRSFLSQGTGAQTVLVSPLERMQFLVTRLGSLTAQDITEGLRTAAERTGYIEYFGRSIETVPDEVPFQDGRLWAEAIEHVLKPRMFFPDKADINDSDRVNEFSGIEVADASQGTSISLGYVAESYIDFGPVLMFAPVFLLGLFWGWSYRLLVSMSAHRLLSFGFAVAFILGSAVTFESSNIKIVGGAIMALLVNWLVLKLYGPALWRLISRVKPMAYPPRSGS